MGWVSVSGATGEFPKWSDVEPGTVIEGIFSGIHQGKFGAPVDVDTDEGRLTYPVPAALDRDLQAVKVGARVRITYYGKQTTRDGSKSFHSFDTQTDEADVVRRARAAARAVPNEDEIPF